MPLADSLMEMAKEIHSHLQDGKTLPARCVVPSLHSNIDQMPEQHLYSHQVTDLKAVYPPLLASNYISHLFYAH